MKGSVVRSVTRRLAALWGIAVVFSLLLPASMASAAATATSVIELQKAPVIPLSCEQCHGNISDTKLPNIKFKHAAHIVYDCSACHSIFPHQPEGTSIPRMRECWNCHALRHGPQGEMATSECGKCHMDMKGSKPVRRPKDHVGNWAGPGHVKPSETVMRTRCMMCHDQKWCDDCHVAKKVIWISKEPYSFDGANGCLACHGSELPRLKAPVSGLDASAHRDIKCGQCHPDFKYTPAKDATPLWRVNAGKACGTGGCHDATITATYSKSIHGQLLQKANFRTATCASCHGGHTIERLKTQSAKNRLHLASQSMCAQCHRPEYLSYDDYWHGKPYKAGALDAPACWDCHGSHSVLQVKDPKGNASPENVAKMCGSCHEGSEEPFTVTTRNLIHGLDKTRSGNPLAAVVDRVFGWDRQPTEGQTP